MWFLRTRSPKARGPRIALRGFVEAAGHMDSIIHEHAIVTRWYRPNNTNSPKLFFRVELIDGGEQVRIE